MWRPVRRPALTAAIALTTAALAACGGSSPTSTTRPATGTAGQAVTAAGASDSTAIDSAPYRELITSAASEKGITPPAAAKIADCVVRKETAQGYKTIADLGRSATSRQQAVQDAAECTSQALPAG